MRIALFLLLLLLLLLPLVAHGFTACSSTAGIRIRRPSLPTYLTLRTTTSSRKTALWQTTSHVETLGSDVTDDNNDGNGNSAELSFRKRLRTKIKSAWKTARQANLIPALVAFVVGYLLGGKAVLRQRLQTAAQQAASTTGATVTAMASKSSSASTSSRPPIFLTASLLFLVGREIWRSIPVWLRRQIPIIGRRSSSSSQQAGTATAGVADPEDWTSLVTLGSKLSALMSIISDKLADETNEQDKTLDGSVGGGAKQNTFATFSAVWKMNQQLRAEGASDRDQSYMASGQLIEHPDVALAGLDQLFEFADWAYDELPNEGTLRDALESIQFTLLRHDKNVLPGSVAHYVALSKENKLAIVGVKGTSSLEDMLTDLCGQAVTHELEGPFISRSSSPITRIRCHEGIFTAAKRLANDLDVLVAELLLPAGYRIILTGHSLGAGVASLCSLMLRARYPALQKTVTIRNQDGDENAEEKNGFFNQKQQDMLSVVAFACPPCLDYDAARACSSFLTTVVNNSDVIPRASLSNLIVTKAVLKEVLRELDEARTTRSRDDNSDGIILSPKEIQNVLNKVQDGMDLRDPDHLYCPGVVLHMFDLWSKQAVAESQIGSEDEVVVNVRTAERIVACDGTSKMLRFIEIDSRMMNDHMAPAYRKSIQDLLSTSAMEKNESNALTL